MFLPCLQFIPHITSGPSLPLSMAIFTPPHTPCAPAMLQYVRIFETASFSHDALSSNLWFPQSKTLFPFFAWPTTVHLRLSKALLPPGSLPCPPLPPRQVTFTILELLAKAVNSQGNIKSSLADGGHIGSKAVYGCVEQMSCGQLSQRTSKGPFT